MTAIDNLNDYYDVSLKIARLKILKEYDNFLFVKSNLEDGEVVADLFRKNSFDCVVNLAAQAGVRYSLKNPSAYVQSNLVGFSNLIEICRRNRIGHFVFASSSSVYGANLTLPYSSHQGVDHPVSLYAATKRANELIAHSYASLYSLPSTGIRLFTVYGPWGRPDMAYFIFTKSIVEERPINVYNFGKMKRDFTYIDDAIEGIIRIINKPPVANDHWNYSDPDPSSSYAPFKIYNLGNNSPTGLLQMIEIIEGYLGKKAVKNFMPMQDGDVVETFADIQDLIEDFGFAPSTPIEVGLRRFVDWYREFYI